MAKDGSDVQAPRDPPLCRDTSPNHEVLAFLPHSEDLNAEHVVGRHFRTQPSAFLGVTCSSRLGESGCGGSLRPQNALVSTVPSAEVASSMASGSSRSSAARRTMLNCSVTNAWVPDAEVLTS